jgi:hypothetical protein
MQKFCHDHQLSIIELIICGTIIMYGMLEKLWNRTTLEEGRCLRSDSGTMPKER